MALGHKQLNLCLVCLQLRFSHFGLFFLWLGFSPWLLEFATSSLETHSPRVHVVPFCDANVDWVGQRSRPENVSRLLEQRHRHVHCSSRQNQPSKSTDGAYEWCFQLARCCRRVNSVASHKAWSYTCLMACVRCLLIPQKENLPTFVDGAVIDISPPAPPDLAQDIIRRFPDNGTVFDAVFDAQAHAQAMVVKLEIAVCRACTCRTFLSFQYSSLGRDNARIFTRYTVLPSNVGSHSLARTGDKPVSHTLDSYHFISCASPYTVVV